MSTTHGPALKVVLVDINRAVTAAWRAAFQAIHMQNRAEPGSIESVAISVLGAASRRASAPA